MRGQQKKTVAITGTHPAATIPVCMVDLTSAAKDFINGSKIILCPTVNRRYIIQWSILQPKELIEG